MTRKKIRNKIDPRDVTRRKIKEFCKKLQFDSTNVLTRYEKIKDSIFRSSSGIALGLIYSEFQPLVSLVPLERKFGTSKSTISENARLILELEQKIKER